MNIGNFGSCAARSMALARMVTPAFAQVGPSPLVGIHSGDRLPTSPEYQISSSLACAIGHIRVGLRSECGWDVALFVNNALGEQADLAIDRERGGDGRLSHIRNQPRRIGLNAGRSS